jgi:hypothetical protein
LHNRQSAQSRDFVAGLPEADHVVIEWYTEGAKVAAFQAAHPGLHPSAFPSVLVSVPAYREPESTDPATGETVPARNIGAHDELLRCPADLAEVEAYVAMAEQRAIEQPVE